MECCKLHEGATYMYIRVVVGLHYIAAARFAGSVI